MSNATLTILSILEAVLLVIVLALALIQIRIRLTTISDGLTALASGVGGVEGYLRLIPPVAPTVNAPLFDIVGALPSLCSMAEQVATSLGK